MLPLLANLEAVKKLSGYLSHSATQFYSFCDLQSSHVEEIEPSSRNEQTGPHVKEQAEILYGVHS